MNYEETSCETIKEAFETLASSLKYRGNWDLDSYEEDQYYGKIRIAKKILSTIQGSAGKHPDDIFTDCLTGIEYKKLESGNKPNFNSTKALHLDIKIK